jgi:hypothetical protein
MPMAFGCCLKLSLSLSLFPYCHSFPVPHKHTATTADDDVVRRFSLEKIPHPAQTESTEHTQQKNKRSSLKGRRRSIGSSCGDTLGFRWIHFSRERNFVISLTIFLPCWRQFSSSLVAHFVMPLHPFSFYVGAEKKRKKKSISIHFLGAEPTRRMD